MEESAPTNSVQAIEANTAAFLLALGHAGGGEERSDAYVSWTIGGSPVDYHNAVVHAALAPDDADTVILASRELMRAHGVPGTWHVGPSMRPADLGERLVAYGFVDQGDEPGMAVDLATLPATVPAPATLTIARVRDEAALRTWEQVLASGFGEGEREAAWTAEMYRRIGLGDNTPWRHYLGLLDDAAVATASMFVHERTAGIYFVFTVEGYRRRGIGAAITLVALHEGRALGARIGVLGASPLGYGVYQRLGFREYCTFRIYAWQPDTKNDAARKP